MNTTPFIADNTIPGLGASDLARLMGATYVMGVGALSTGAAKPKPGLLKRMILKLTGRK